MARKAPKETLPRCSRRSCRRSGARFGDFLVNLAGGHGLLATVRVDLFRKVDLESVTGHRPDVRWSQPRRVLVTGRIGYGGKEGREVIFLTLKSVTPSHLISEF